MDSLTMIDGDSYDYLIIRENLILTSVAFESLTEIGALDIDGNDALTSFTANSLETIDERISIHDNPALIEFSLAGLNSVSGAIQIENNTALTGFALDSLSRVEGTEPDFGIGDAIIISNNPALASFSIDAPLTVGASIEIEHNEALTNFRSMA